MSPVFLKSQSFHLFWLYRPTACSIIYLLYLFPLTYLKKLKGKLYITTINGKPASLVTNSKPHKNECMTIKIKKVHSVPPEASPTWAVVH